MKKLFYLCAAAAVLVFSCGKDETSSKGDGGQRPAPPDTTAVTPPDTTGRPDPEPLPEKLPSPDRIPIVAWHGVRASLVSVARFREAAELGITVNYTRFSDTETACKALEYAGQAGVKLIVECDALYSDTRREAAVKKLMRYPALEAYFCKDEPLCSEFPTIARMMNAVQAVDPDHYCYANLFPAGPAEHLQALGVATYREYVQRYLNEVPAAFLSFDEYPLVTNPGSSVRLIKDTWYEDLEIVADEARKANKKFWAFALTCPHVVYPVPTLSDLRLQLYSDLAYGAQVLQYFTYWTPTVSGDWNYRMAPIAQDGTRTATYDLVKTVTSEIQRLSGVFLGARVVSVRHTGTSVPKGTVRLTDLPEPVRRLETEGSGAVVSQLENQGYTFLVIVNRDPNTAMGLRFEAESRVRQVLKNGSIVPADDITEMTVDPGDAVIYMW